MKKKAFLDGGINANNPSLFAYSFAMESVRRERIRVVSLGTGDYIQSNLPLGSKQGFLFWAAHLHHFLSASQNDVDRQLSYSLGPERYHRFQFWMDHENTIPLDAVEKTDELIEMGREMVEENIDGINTLVERGHARLGR